MNAGPLRYYDGFKHFVSFLLWTWSNLTCLGGKNPDLFNVRKDLVFQNSLKLTFQVHVSLNFLYDPDPVAAFVKMLRWLNQIGSNCATGIPVYKTCCPRLVGLFLFLRFHTWEGPIISISQASHQATPPIPRSIPQIIYHCWRSSSCENDTFFAAAGAAGARVDTQRVVEFPFKKGLVRNPLKKERMLGWSFLG